MTDLTEKSLADTIIEIIELQKKTGQAICIHPTHFVVPRYPDDSDEEYFKRVEACRKAVEKFKKVGA